MYTYWRLHSTFCTWIKNTICLQTKVMKPTRLFKPWFLIGMILVSFQAEVFMTQNPPCHNCLGPSDPLPEGSYLLQK